MQRSRASVMPPATRALIDDRVGQLNGTTDWIRAASMPFQRTGSSKAIDWKQLLQFGAEYCFADDVPEQCSEAFWAIIHVLREVLDATCDVAGEASGVTMAEEVENVANLQRMKRRAVLALAKLEKDAPWTELPIILHIIIHLPATISRWNNVRNTWAFHSERYT